MVDRNIIEAGAEDWCRGPEMVDHKSGTQWLDDRDVG
jgi:hypothetical protein